MVAEWKKNLVGPEVSIRETIKVIDSSSLQIALVINTRNQLLGTVTDGDVRRALLQNISLDDSVSKIMEKSPSVCRVDQGYDLNPNYLKEEIISLMKEKEVHQVPLVDAQGVLLGLEVLDSFLKFESLDNWVLIMAGGLGKRLRPMTNECPKPMLKVGGRPILESIVEKFRLHGFTNLFVSVNFEGDQIKSYFGDGAQFGVKIQYIEEESPYGTAGALALLPEKPAKPMIIMNGDLITSLNFQHLLQFHEEHKKLATMSVCELQLEVPYGVVSLEEQFVINVEEKPRQKFFINGGVYVIEPVLIDCIPKNTHFDMTSLLQLMKEKNEKITAFPVREYWLDVGRNIDFIKANQDFHGISLL